MCHQKQNLLELAHLQWKASSDQFLFHILEAHWFVQKFLEGGFYPCNDLVCQRRKRPICLFCKLIKAGFSLARRGPGAGPRTRKIRDCIRGGGKGWLGTITDWKLWILHGWFVLKVFRDHLFEKCNQQPPLPSYDLMPLSFCSKLNILSPLLYFSLSFCLGAKLYLKVLCFGLSQLLVRHWRLYFSCWGRLENQCEIPVRNPGYFR